jgi:hypothetical protein
MPIKTGYVFNLVMLLITTIIGATYPHVGSILGKVGALCGLFMMYILPIIVHLRRQAHMIRNPSLALALHENRIKSIHETESSQ